MRVGTGVAVAVLMLSVLITWLLGRAKALGPLTLAGFVLGIAATGSAFALFG